MSARTLLMAAATAGPPGASLNLSFMSGTLDPRITFTRASTATYSNSSGTMQTAATNAPRFDYDPSTLALRGLLLEEARTNIALQSGNMSVAPWTPNGLTSAAPTVVANAAMAPDGTTTATRLNYPTVNAGVSTLNNNIAVTAAVYTFSIWARGVVGGESLWLSVTIDAVTYYRTPMVLTTSWQRFSVTTPTLTAATWVMLAGTDLRDGGQTAKPAQSVYLWGAQIEIGAFPTSYIPTAAASATRAIDQCSIPPANMSWFMSPGGSWAAEFISLNPTPQGLRIISYPAASSISPLVFINPSALVGQYDGSAAMNVLNSFAANTVAKAATTWAAPSSARACVNAGAIASAALSSGYATFATGGLLLISSGYAGETLSGYIRRLRYWPRALSDAEMQQVTR